MHGVLIVFTPCIFIMKPVTSIAAILTYKNKLLLTCSDIEPRNVKNYPWAFVHGQATSRQKPQEVVSQIIHFATGLTVNPGLIHTDTDENNNQSLYFHSKLSDHHVNMLERLSGNRIEFFTLHEIKSLELTPQTQYFMQTNPQLLDQIMT